MSQKINLGQAIYCWEAQPTNEPEVFPTTFPEQKHTDFHYSKNVRLTFVNTLHCKF